MKLLATNEVAERLGVTVARVQKLIWDGRLPAMKIGRDYVIQEEDLKLVEDRKPGRPRTKNEDDVADRKGSTKKTQKKN